MRIRPEDCPITPAFNLIGAKWTGLIIWHLLKGSLRYSELQQALPGISPKTLAERLQTLENEKLLERNVIPAKPPRVEYTLTQRGHALSEVFAAIERWVALDRQLT
ncbi:helix-turn-helix domain-containing protein [Lentzea sp. NPDC051208]|uniref:winged helix-turn-helix transcriptional regulator n=1 Tax=Lentzea sp. NPDC051208 TaxID=3154642 RepID=UPI003433F13B